jgi:peptidoglycan/xylan/chitin deacetylase (PgdA/CDA1 family)
LFRPPEGSINDSARLSAKDHGYDIVLWSVDTRDWTGRPTEEIVQEVLSHVQNGSIILLHDSVFAHESHTAQALRQFLPVLREQGYEFVRVSDLLYGGS